MMLTLELENATVAVNDEHILAVCVNEEGPLTGATPTVKATRRGWRHLVVTSRDNHAVRGWMTVRRVNRLLADLEAR